MIMKFKDWIHYDVDSKDIIYNCVDPTGFDRDNYIYPLGCQNIPINSSLFTNHPEVNSSLLFYSFNSVSGLSRRGFKGNMFNGTLAQSARNYYKNILDKNYQMTPLPQQEYYNELGKFKFIISPEGNGIDCFRHYETWISKGIPIIERNAFIQKKYQGLPILWTTNYSEINDSYLEKCYEVFLEQTFDFRRLLLSQYHPQIRKQIKFINSLDKHDGRTSRRINRNRFWNYTEFLTKD